MEKQEVERVVLGTSAAATRITSIKVSSNVRCLEWGKERKHRTMEEKQKDQRKK